MTWQNQQNGCGSSEDSDQPGHLPSLISLRCPHEETLSPQLPIERTAKTDQTGRMPRLILVFAGCTLILCWFCHVVAHLMLDAQNQEIFLMNKFPAIDSMSPTFVII